MRCIYAEPYGLAHRNLRGQPVNHTLQPTALVDEAYLRLAGDVPVLRGRSHFMCLASAHHATNPGPGRTLAEELLLLQRSPHDPPPVPPAALLPRSDPQQLTQVIGIVADAASALDQAHRRGVIHRDVKPSNLLLTPDGTVKLVDFGVAHDEEFGSLTRSDQLLGTLRYMSPEQARVVEAKVDHRTDVYSLGVVMYEVLTLRCPFAGATTHERMMHIRSQESRPVSAINPRVPRDLAVICQHSMSKRLSERYESAAAFEGDLRRFLRHEAILARPPSVRVRVLRFAHRHRASCVVVVVALLALGVGGSLAERAARARAIEVQMTRRAALAEVVDWGKVDDKELVEARRALAALQDATLSGDERALCGSLEARMALTVVQELKQDDERVLLVRLGDRSAAATTCYVEWPSGRVRRLDGLTYIEGLGRIGQKVRFEDWKDVNGALLPGRVVIEFAHPLIGTILNSVESVEIGVEVPAGHFELAD